MNAETVSRCPKCQAVVAPEAPQGLCPKCLLAAAAAPTEAGQPTETPPLPALETIAAAFPQLEIIEFVGQGGMGLVYKARQPKLERLVALKLLPQAAGADPAFGERFNREARVLARLSHPNIVAVHDFGQAGGFYYLLMEFVAGVNLRQAMRAGRFTPAQALALVPKICDALQYAHEEGVLHRDIKPENLLLDARGRIKIADFGIAKLKGEVRDITLTASGAALGTPHYMAPEQLEHPQDVDQRADIYSLGVVFYEMLTGELPLGRFAPPSEKSAVDARIDEIVFRALERERERRFQTAGEVKTRVEHVTANPAVGGPPPIGPATPAPAPPPGAESRAAGPERWCVRAIVGAAMVAMSLCLTPLLLVIPGRLASAQWWFWMVVIDLWALPGAALGWSALRVIRKASGQLRGERLAFFAVLAYLIPISPTVWGGRWGLLRHGPFGFFSPLLIMFVWMAFLGLNVFALSRWFQGEPRDRILFSAAGVVRRLRRLPHPVLWTSGAALLLCFLLLLLLVVVRSARDSHLSLPASATMPAGPEAPPGYEVGPGSPPANDQEYQSTLTVPAGYALTLTATLSSNQVVLRRSDPPPAAFIIAPSGASAQASLKWRLLGNTTLADGAPLQFALDATPEGDGSRTSFLFTPPVPVTIDWVSEPAQLWPPQNGHTKCLLAKGTAAASEPPVAPPVVPSTPAGAPPTVETVSWQQPVEWAVGLEMRLDPVPPARRAQISRPVLGTGTNWSMALAAKPAAGQLELPALEMLTTNLPASGAPPNAP